MQTYNTTAFDSITLDFDQNIIADVADVNDDGRADIVFTIVDETYYKLYVSYDQASSGSPTFNTAQILSQFSVEHGHNYTAPSCTDDGYVSADCNIGGNSGGQCHMGGASTCFFLHLLRTNSIARFNKYEHRTDLTDVNDDSCVHTFDSDDITKYFVEDNNAINCSSITYGCDVFEGVGVRGVRALVFEFSSQSSLNYPSNTTSITVLLTSSRIFEHSNTNARTQVHMCGGYENIIVVDEGPTNETETPVDILTDYRIDYSLKISNPLITVVRVWVFLLCMWCLSFSLLMTRTCVRARSASSLFVTFECEHSSVVIQVIFL